MDVKERLIVPIVIILILYIIGIVVYTHFEGWSVLDSIYFQTTTFTTVGFGDIVPITDQGKIFTIVFIWVGISAALYLIYSISDYREQVFDKHVEDVVKKIIRRKKY